MMMINDGAFVAKLFRKNFSADDKLAIYGLGRNTKIILEQCSEYKILGLLDKVRSGEKEWGLPIITVEEAYALGVQKIVIIATSANVPIIYHRIKNECEKYGIEIYDVNGEQKKSSEGKYILNPFYALCTAEKLKEKIDSADVISFDIFDTLLVRDVLQPTDIFEIIECKNRELLQFKIPFSEIRVRCERKLYETCNPTIYDIYDEIQYETRMGDEQIKMLLRSEIEEEQKHLMVRKDMQNILEYALECGKIVCCTSDMYLTRDILEKILKKNGYKSFDNIFISCEYDLSKNNGLFEIVRRMYPCEKILHIGDNYDADIFAAKKYGIDETFQIPSVYQMISDGVSHRVLNQGMDLKDRNELGNLFSYLYNNPFIFASTEGKCEVKDNYSLGYYFIEPLLASFLEWMLEKCALQNIELLLLGARDGWIIQKMLEIREEYKKNHIPYDYLYVSRYACTLAGMETYKDVLCAFSIPFDGTIEQLLENRFSLDSSELLKRCNNESNESYFERHIPRILEKTETYRKKYRKYLEKYKLNPKKVGFFDFVSSGTCQLWLEHIWPEAEWTGYYFIRNLDTYKKNLDIKSYFESQYVYEMRSKLYKNYIFMENIMTSFEAALHGFTNEGNILFEAELRSNIQINKLREVHEGILSAYRVRLRSGNNVASREIVDEILDILNNEYSIMQADFFEDNVLDDIFCNRKFDLKR